MSISGFVIHTNPDRAAALHQQLVSLDGVEIHATGPDGSLVVTLDEPNERAAGQRLLEIDRLPGVISTALVYNYFDPPPEAEETVS